MLLLDSAKYRAAQTDAEVKRLTETVEEAFLSRVVNDLSFPRHYVANRANNRRAGTWVADAFRSLGYDVQKSGSYANIVATPPEIPPGPRILIGSHYDTVPGSPGADDNASAIAVSLAGAQALANSPEVASVVFVCFNREEDNLRGSTEFVDQHLRDDAFSLHPVHILEMVGYRSHQPGSQQLPPGLPIIRAPDVGDFLALVANRTSNRFVKPLLRAANAYCEGLHVMGLQVFLGLEQRFPHLLRSDHAPFWRAGIPALMWTDTSEFRNAHYHKPTDTATTLDYGFMKQVAQLLLVSILSHKT